MENLKKNLLSEEELNQVTGGVENKKPTTNSNL